MHRPWKRRRPRVRRRMSRPLALLLALLGYANRLPEQAEIPRSEAIPALPDARLAQRYAAAVQVHPGRSGFMLLSDGEDAFDARMRLIDTADHSIDLQSYIFRGDATGALIAGRLLAAADRGVRIRLLLDDIGSLPNDADIAALAAHPHIDIRLFNPLLNRSGAGRLLELLGSFQDVNRRMHNKLLVVDGIAIITGGRNIGNEYFAAAEIDFRDLDVLGIGPVAEACARHFDGFWNSGLAIPIRLLASFPDLGQRLNRLRKQLAEHEAHAREGHYFQTGEISDFSRRFQEDRLPLVWSRAQVLADPADKVLGPEALEDDYLGAQLSPYVGRLRQELLAVSAYFVPGKGGVRQLGRLERQGIQVRILTNSLATTDVALVHSGYSKYRKPLLRAGVELFELRPDAGPRPKRHWLGRASRASLHAKTLVFDRETVFIGSINLDPRSWHQNTELGVMLECPELASQVARLIDHMMEPAQAYRLGLSPPRPGHRRHLTWTRQEGDRTLTQDREPDTGFWLRLATRLLSWLPVDSQI